MKIAHLILAHKNPVQLQKLITALSHPSFDFYIHVDKKVDITLFSDLTSIKNTYIIKKGQISIGLDMEPFRQQLTALKRSYKINMTT